MTNRIRRKAAYPLAADYYRDMERLASKLLSGWQNQGDNPFGEALLQVAAYMQGQVAQRLAQVPERDRAAFYRMLDIPAGGLEAAHAPMVFLLSEKQTQPLYLPKRTQVAGQSGDDEVFFETDQLLHLAAGRLGFITAADERQDRIELIPPGFLELAPPVVYPAYRVSSFAAKGNTLLQVDPADQLEAGMVISLAQSYYRISSVEDEFIRLKDPLASDVAVETSFSVLTDFPNGVLPDVQQHALYIGHNQLFNLEGAAAISLQFAAAGENDPGELIERLADHCQVRWQWYGKIEKEGAEDWQDFMGCPVTPGVNTCGLICLGKPEGEVTEFEVNGQKSRWIRALLLPGAGGQEALHRPYLVEGVRLKVASMLNEERNESGSSEEDSSENSGDGEQGTQGKGGALNSLQEICSGKPVSNLCKGEKIKKALHNETVLTVDGEFRPFGSVPQIQDRFVISAPEVLSKKGAVAGFNFRFVSGEIKGFASVIDDPGKAYAITDSNQLMQLNLSQVIPVRNIIGASGIEQFDDEFIPQSVLVTSDNGNNMFHLVLCKLDGAGLAFLKIVNFDDKEAIIIEKFLCFLGYGDPEVDCDNDRLGLTKEECSKAKQFNLNLSDVGHDSIKNGDAHLLSSRQLLLSINGEVNVCSISFLENNTLNLVLRKADKNITHFLDSNSNIIDDSDILKKCVSTEIVKEVSSLIKYPEELFFWKEDEAGSGLYSKINTGYESVFVEGFHHYFYKDGVKLSDHAWQKSESRALSVCDGKIYFFGDKAEYKDITIALEGSDKLFQVKESNIVSGKWEDPADASIFIDVNFIDIPLPDDLSDNRVVFVDIYSKLNFQENDVNYLLVFEDDSEQYLTKFNEVVVYDEKITHQGEIFVVFKNKPADFLNMRKVLYTRWNKDTFPPYHNYQTPNLSWEYYDGEAWSQLQVGEANNNFIDGTRHFKQSGCVTFNVPKNLSPTELAGKEDYWIRARLIGGDYGQPKYKVEESVVDGVKTQTVITDTSDLHPPEIIEVTASFSQEKYQTAEAVITENNLDFRNRTVASLSPNASFPLFEDVSCISNHKLETKRRGNYLYLGFTHSCELSPLSLWADVKEINEVPGEGELAVETLSQRGWITLSVVDQTRALRQQGYIKITVDETPVQTRLFGQYLFWLRFSCRLDQDTIVTEKISDTDNSARDNRLHHAGWHPHLKALHMNAAEALQARTVEQELVGSSTGEPNQVFSLSQPPVLAQSLELRVREQLDDAERETLMNALLPPDQPDAVVRFDKASLLGDWVLWQRVDSFIGQLPDARVYRLDAEQGKIQFSDSCQGRIPPAGSNNIRAIHYQNGGGRVGNLAAYKIDQLKSAVKFVDTVNNPLAARGGMDIPVPASQISMAPAAVRQGIHSTLAAPDIEAWLVAEFREVVLAKCLPPDGKYPFMRLIILVANGEICPEPSMALRLTIRDRLLEKGWGGLDKDAVEVLAPEYVPVEVRVSLNATHEKHIAWLKQQADTALKQYLHPVAPGGAAANRPFGRALYVSDLLQQLTGSGGLERIIDVQMRVFDPCRPAVTDAQEVKSGRDEPIAVPRYGLICADPRYLKVKVVATNEQEVLCPSR